MASTVSSVARDNGLPKAATYVGLIDVDPPIADQVLEVLARMGIAAYAEPYVGRDPYLALKPLKRPSERIWVDQSKTDLARASITTHLPALQADILAVAAAQRDREAMGAMQKALVDDQFSSIAQRLAAEGIGQQERTVAPPASIDDEVEGFRPPTPAPLPKTTRVGRAAWLAAICGPLVAVLGALIPGARWLSALGLAAFLTGFVVLVARMPERAGRDDGWDDGAVV